ncbi:MAG: GMC family oxidoreductase [Chloroflexi bacterium]|nr:GMC family oxidoreductase [Chloroflexota bacterium]MCI0903616.1 GMC family oxidoreductase [Chloroflexota bacterium]
MRQNQYDIIIIGSGAGGGTLAYRLAPSGKRVLILERGGYLRREKENWDSKEVFVNGRYNNAENWLDGKGREFQPGQHYFVGGNTKFYGAVLLRMRQEDFGELQHHGGISPAWPLSYDDFEPYYTQAEQIYQVHGERGIDPTEPWASGPLPYPSVSNEPRIQELADDLRRIGNTPFPLPVGIMLNEAQPHLSPCIRCDTCDGFPCMVNAKADAHVVCVEPALAHDNVTLLTDSKVIFLETSPDGRSVTGVVVERGGQQETYSADVVVVSCGAVNSAALLLRSAGDKHPNGLANSSGMVGRHYMAHNNSALMALSLRPNPTVFQKTIGINDFYFGSDDWKYPLGHIQMLGKSNADMLRDSAPRLVPGRALEEMASHSLDFWLTSEDLPLPGNRVTVNRSGQIVLRYKNNNTEGHKRLVKKLRGMLKEIGAENHLIPSSLYMGKKIPLAGVAHQNGTLRFGSDPKDSVLDLNCKAHDMDNLYVVDSSFFVSSSAVNPTLTIAANALRVGGHILERMR